MKRWQFLVGFVSFSAIAILAGVTVRTRSNKLTASAVLTPPWRSGASCSPAHRRGSPAGTAEPDRYRLDIDAVATEDKSIEDSSNSRSARRATVRVMANFELRDLSGGKTVYKGRTFSNVSYDDVQQSFADLQARTNAMERGAHEIALDIRTRLAAHFASR